METPSLLADGRSTEWTLSTSSNLVYVKKFMVTTGPNCGGRRRWEDQKSSTERAAHCRGLKFFYTNYPQISRFALLVDWTHGTIAPPYTIVILELRLK